MSLPHIRSLFKGQAIHNKETEARLNVWCNNSNDSIAIAGAKAGRQYGEANKNNKEALAKINDFEWLKEQYNDNPI